MKLFVDMDGVLVDFDKGYLEAFGELPNWSGSDGWEHAKSSKWELIRSVPRFYRKLEAMADAHALWYEIQHLNPIILTGVPPELPNVIEEKKEWVVDYLGSEIPFIACLSEEKYLHGKPGDILIDDREKCGLPWVVMGGIWIEHKTAEQTIKRLEELV